MHLFRGQTADEVWRAAYEVLSLASPQTGVQPSRAGETYELLHAVFEVTEPRERWVLSRRPAVSPAFGIAEVIWILAGSNDAAVLNFWFSRLPEFAGEGPVYAGAYGHRLRCHFGIDQLRRACDTLASKPESRQVVLQIWDVQTDLPDVTGAPRSPDVPCNVCSLLKLRMGRLEWTQVMRSNDLLQGLPHNFVQFTCLQEIMAGWLGVELGSYHHWSDSLHIYCATAESFSCEPLCVVPPNTDSLATGFEQGVAIIEDLYRRLTELALVDLGVADLEDIVAMPDAPAGYRNFLYVLGAESARRNGRHDQAAALATECTNPQLRTAWAAWWERVGNRRQE
jgi:thymidylate synthase